MTADRVLKVMNWSVLALVVGAGLIGLFSLAGCRTISGPDSAKDTPHSNGCYTDNDGYFSVGCSRLSHLFGTSNVPPDSCMVACVEARMLPVFENRQVLWRIVRLVSVDMVNDFRGKERPSKTLLNNESMFKNAPTSGAHSTIPFSIKTSRSSAGVLTGLSTKAAKDRSPTNAKMSSAMFTLSVEHLAAPISSEVLGSGGGGFRCRSHQTTRRTV